MSLTMEGFHKMHGIEENPRAKAGNNNPPDAIERSKEALGQLAEFIREEPVIADEVKARQAKVLIDRAKGSLDEMEKERDGKVRPLNMQVKTINASYKSPYSILETALNTLTKRVNAYMDEVKAEAEEKARIAREEADRLVREAEEALKAKQEADDNAEQGEIGVDVIAAEAEARQKIADANKAIRASQRADKDTNVRIGGGFGRVLTQKTKETIVITDRHKMLTALGYPQSVDESMITAARAYRRLKGELPEGCKSETEKSL